MMKEMGFEGGLKGREGGFQTERKRESVPSIGGKDREGAGSKGAEFGAWDGEAEGVSSRAEGAWRGVWLERVGEVGWGEVVERSVAEGQNLVLHTFVLTLASVYLLIY